MIRETGGSAGIRDKGLLESAVAQPKASFEKIELYRTLESKAAAFCFSTVMNHPFVDGNKRTGFVAADTFLRINGYFLEVDQQLGEESILQLASGQISKEQLATWFAENLRALNK